MVFCDKSFDILFPVNIRYEVTRIMYFVIIISSEMYVNMD